ncbi:YabP/YqfC family sporulation protein [Oscillospiraceae bacterium OttesenSCG-928-G22]|nr:YabP/YqfC family sporulation protein [Oscillospiraceae bacterium OttesenSCG-928-G22]
MEQEKNNKGGIFERAAAYLDLPGEVLLTVPKIEVTGGYEALIENHQGILEYGDTEMRVNGGAAVLKVTGEGLELVAMNASEMKIRGRIFAVEFVY